jgi:hypothetical protein
MGGMSTMALAGVQFLFIGATFGAMYAWLAPSGLATWARVLASLLVALLFTVALIALHDIARRRAKIRSVRQPELMDGRAVVLVGHIVTVGQTMTAPFSGAECAASFFTASVTGARGARAGHPRWLLDRSGCVQNVGGRPEAQRLSSNHSSGFPCGSR